MKISELMSRDVVTASPGNSVKRAAELMLRHHVSGLPVLDDSGALVGMITEGDLLARALHALDGSSALPVAPVSARVFLKERAWQVADVMTADPVAVSPDCDVHDVVRLMRAHVIKRIPVATQGRLLGIVSRADILRMIVAAPRESTIQDDDALRRAIGARLPDVLELRGSHVDVAVSSGIVSLSGVVESECVRRAARVLAECVGGVQGVDDDDLVVVAGGTPPMPASDLAHCGAAATRA